MKELLRKMSLISAAAVAFVVAPSVMAMPVVDSMTFDVNTLGISSGVALGYTGTLAVNSNSSTTLNDFRTLTNPGGIVVSPAINGGLQSLSASVNFVGGFVTGGNLTLVYDNGDSTTTTYTADVIPQSVSGVGQLQTQSTVLGTLQFSVDTENGQFDNNNIGGYDISPWINAQSFPGNHLFGSVITFALNPSKQTADMDLTVLVPLPSSALMGIASLAGLGALRAFRRRKIA